MDLARQKRLYDTMLAEHMGSLRQMAFVAGPRQVGKTTACREAADRLLSWDDPDDRRLILRGPKAVAAELGLSRLSKAKLSVAFDELHKYRQWKAFLKGFFDGFADRARVLVTGSSRLDVYRRGGDSLMGRYFLYRMHPLSVGELIRQDLRGELVQASRVLPHAAYDGLWTHGGFPEPFLRADPRFSRRWRRLRRQQLVREDIRDLTSIQELDQLEVLVAMLSERSARQLNYSSLSRELGAAVDTIKRWVGALCSLYHGFLLRPWFRNVNKSLRKEPRWFLTDWSGVDDPGQRAETFVACHLLKAVQVWHDLGLGDLALHYLRDKNKREVDFLIARDKRPWFLVEVKQSDETLSPHLAYFQAQTGARHAFQAVVAMRPSDADCFSRTDPCVVPLRTLLSQLP
jgi:predicted AAA+ superfamily ATPase